MSSSTEFRTRSFYGITLSSDFPFASHLPPGNGNPDLTFCVLHRDPQVVDWQGIDPVFGSGDLTDHGESALSIIRTSGCEIMHFANMADFYLWPDRIICHLLNTKYAHMVEILFLGIVLAYWLEQHKVLALHASAVVIGEYAIGFLGTHGQGKTSLAATLVNAGYPLLSDDILPVELKVGNPLSKPGYPQMRMWPEGARHFLGNSEGFDIVHPGYDKLRVPIGDGSFGSFCGEPRPLRCLYVLMRCKPAVMHDQVRFEFVPPRDAFFALVRFSFTPWLIEGLGMQAERLPLIGQVVKGLHVRRVVYPSHLELLPEVAEAIVKDANALGALK